MARRVLLCLLALAVVAALKGGFKAKGATDKGSTDGDGSNGAGFTSPDGGDASALARAHCTGVRRSRDVIVYLGQKQHSTYDKTHKNTLNASMELLRHNMLRIGESDVVVWHEGDLTAADATALDGKANVRFCLLSQATGWGKPDWLSVVPESKFSAGYRFM
ncbi:hypothetical protein M885DRAFT_495698 [Pelagophyceae sp. CCMP2097]|nr:hypothetical protein M885DRAFT_495698 [Pelagophyceae sp. CCMP2097]